MARRAVVALAPSDAARAGRLVVCWAVTLSGRLEFHCGTDERDYGKLFAVSDVSAVYHQR